MSLLIGILTLAVAPSVATAAPNVIKFSIGAQAQFVNQGHIQVPVSVTCPPTAGFANGFVQVFQQATGATGGGGFGVQCTGSSQTVVVDVFGFPWTLGPAIANGGAFTAGFSDFDQRRIQIAF